MKHEDSTLYPEQVSEFEVPAEADGPIKIVKNHLKPGETDPNAAKSAATGVCVCVNVCVAYDSVFSLPYTALVRLVVVPQPRKCQCALVVLHVLQQDLQFAKE